MRDKRVFDMVFFSMFVAIIFVMSYIPYVGFIPLGIGNATTLHIPVIIVAFLFGKKYGTYAGISFGLASLVIVLIRGATVFDYFFIQQPILLTILPRVAFGFIAAAIYQLISKLVKNDYVAIPISAGIGSLLHSVMVLGMITLLFYGEQSNKFGEMYLDIKVIRGIFLTFSLAEAALAILIATPAVTALKAYKKGE